MGSKAKLAKELLPIILKDRQPDQFYVEPFAGGMNMICEVSGNRIANDLNQYLIAMWQDLLNGADFPVEISKNLYDEARDCFYNRISQTMSLGLIGWIGFVASFNGKFFDGGYSGNNNKRNYCAEYAQNIKKQISKMQNTQLFSKSYEQLQIPNNSIIYCDIPYKNTTRYNTSKNFNYDLFWDWCRNMAKLGHQIFISEYVAPNDFKCVWEKNVKNGVRNKIKATEKLFTI